MKKSFYPVLLVSLSLIFSTYKLQAQTWEVFDLQGNLKSRAIYHEIQLLSESVIVGKNSTGLFLLSPALKPIVSLQGESVYQYLAPWILVKGPNGIGAYHEYGQQVLAPEYDEIQTYVTRLLARKGNQYWIFEKGTNRTIPLGTLDQGKLTHLGMVITQKNGSYFLPQSNQPEKAYELLQDTGGRYILAKESTGFGIINIEGNYVMEPTLDQLEYSKNDHFYGFEQNQYVLIKGDDLKADVSYNSYHKITKEGDLMLEFIHGKLRRVMDEGGILLDIVGMEEVQLVGNETYFIRFRDQKTGLLGAKGWLVQPQSDADWIGTGSEGSFPARKSDRIGLLNAEGKWIINPIYQDIKPFSEQVGFYKSANQWGMISSNGQVLALPTWEDVKTFSQGKSIGKNLDGLVLLDRTGNQINPETYDQICRVKEGYFVVEKSGKRGLLNGEGQEVLAPEFDFVQFENKDFIVLGKEGKVGVVKESGDVIFPFNYESIQADWFNGQILAKELYVPVVIPIEEPTTGKRKKGA